MRKKDRILKIQELIIAQGEVLVTELAELFSVSEVTIRNDLEEMEAGGRLQRVHGGARMKESVENAFFPRSILRADITDFTAEKVHIGRLARQVIPEREWIFLGCGDTCAAIAQALLDRQVNVVTNNLIAAAILTLNHNAEVCVTGGTLSGYDHHFMAGDVFQNSMRNLRVKLAIFGASGVEYDTGFSCSSVYERGVFEAVSAVSESIVFALGSEKFGVQSFTSIASVSDANLTLSDPGVPANYREGLALRGAPVATSFEDLSGFGAQPATRAIV